MKKWICALLIALLCAAGLAEEGAVVGTALPLETDEVYLLDLDGDGSEETVRVWMQNYEGTDNLQLLVETDELIYSYDTYIMYGEKIYAADLDGNGTIEMLLCGDESSADFFTWCLEFDREKGIQPIPFADANRGENTQEYFDCGYGQIDEIAGNTLTLSGSQDALGTWWCSRQFTLRDGRFELDDDGLWHVTESFDDPEIWEYRALILTRSLNVTMEDGSAATLPVGERLLITETDKETFVGFVTREGVRGTFPIAPDEQEGWGFLVEGENEYEFFEDIPYAD